MLVALADYKECWVALWAALAEPAVVLVALVDCLKASAVHKAAAKVVVYKVCWVVWLALAVLVD
jgi:hypothetical protein